MHRAGEGWTYGSMSLGFQTGLGMGLTRFRTGVRFPLSLPFLIVDQEHW